MKTKIFVATVVLYIMAFAFNLEKQAEAACKGGTETESYECIAGENDCVLSSCTDCGPFTTELEGF